MGSLHSSPLPEVEVSDAVEVIPVAVEVIPVAVEVIPVAGVVVVVADGGEVAGGPYKKKNRNKYFYNPTYPLHSWNLTINYLTEFLSEDMFHLHTSS